MAKSEFIVSFYAYERRLRKIANKARRRTWKLKHDPKFILWRTRRKAKHSRDNKPPMLLY
ncbi:hypothetical protein ES705_22118 [subsurface metagenome]